MREILGTIKKHTRHATRRPLIATPVTEFGQFVHQLIQSGEDCESQAPKTNKQRLRNECG